MMKLAKESERPARSQKPERQKGKKQMENALSDADAPLFEKLRELRLEIAREEKVPPYIVFTDKTLTHMCMIKPVTREEMLSVSGVGAFKYEKYGERFINCIHKYRADNSIN